MPARSRATSTAARTPQRPSPRVVDVTAVLVAHDGARWLPQVLAALAGQTVQPARVVCVDTGSTDDSRALLVEALGADALVELPPDTGYGAAVAAGLAHAGEQPGASPSWIWLLHDDAAPAPTALEALLDHAEESPSAVLLGPKVLDWDDPRVLVEVGLTTDAAGHRETGLERREYDQGQHDAPRDVLAVGTAGALVRRHVWQTLGGLAPELPVFRDDLDLGWRVNAAGHRVVVVPAAQVVHARAATTGRRSPGAAPGRPAGVDRRHALFVLLAHVPALLLPLAVLRLVLACLLRTTGFLLTRQVLAARDEVAALGSVLLRPGRLRRARKTRARTRTVPARSLRSLFASGTGRARARTEALGGWLAGGGTRGNDPLRALGDPGPEGPDELGDLGSGGGTLRRILVRPGVLLFLGLALLALLAERSLLPLGGDRLAGGRLLPPPDGASDLWASYASSWHATSVGSDALAPPATAVLAALSTVLLGKTWLAVDLLLLASVPIAGAVAYVVAGRLVDGVVLRLWAAATWALLPVATGAVAAGRLDAAVVQIALPPLLLAGCRLLSRDPGRAGWHRAWAVGLALSVVVALAPTLWPCAVVLLLGGGLWALRAAPGADGQRRLLAAYIAAVVPLVVLLPWSFEALTSAGVLHGPGRLVADPALVEPGLPGWHLLLLSPGGAGLPAVLVPVGLVLAALAGLARRRRTTPARAGWAVALVGLAAALLLSRLDVPVPGTARSLPVWPGVPLQVAAGGLLAAALVAADRARERLAAADFGWRQLTAVLVTAAAVVVPALAGGAWLLRGADDPLQRGLPDLLPAFARAELEVAPGQRVLALAPRADGQVGYELTGVDGARLTDPATPPEPAQAADLDALVADLLSPRGSTAAQALATRSVRYVVLPPSPEAEPLRDVLDQQPDLSRRSDEQVLLWEVAGPAGALTVLPPSVAAAAVAGEAGLDRTLPEAAETVALELEDAAGGLADGARAEVPEGPADRLLVLGEAADDDWVATVDGQPLERRTAWGWAQAFALPAEGGALEVSHDGGRSAALVAQGIALLVVAVLAAPGARRRRGLEVDPTDDREQAEVEAPPAAVSRSRGRHAAGAAS